jgi:hypothetical protein
MLAMSPTIIFALVNSLTLHPLTQIQSYDAANINQIITFQAIVQ